MIKDITKKLKNNTALTSKEQEVLLFILDNQQKCIDYYSQNFTGTWDNDKCNVNWRAQKYHAQLESKMKELTERDVIDIKVEENNV